MKKLSVKDFKYFDKGLEVVATDTKQLIALPVLTDDTLVYNVIRECEKNSVKMNPSMIK